MNSFWIGKAVHSKMEFLELLRGGGGGGGGAQTLSLTDSKVTFEKIWVFFGQN